MKMITACLLFISYLLIIQQCNAMIDHNEMGVASLKSGMKNRLNFQQRMRFLQGKGNSAARYTQPPDDIMLFNVGYEHNCVVFWVGANKIRCWGANGYGQLGLGDTLNRGDQANEMGEKLPFVALGKAKPVSDLVLGGFHTCVTFDDQRVKCFGDNRFGQLALGDTNNRGDQPNEMGDKLPFIDIGADKKIMRIMAGFLHTCMAVTGSRVICFGNNEHGQLGGGATDHRGGSINHVGSNAVYADVTLVVPYHLFTGPTANHTCILDSSIPKCWGSNSKGQLGYGDTNNRGDQPYEMCNNLPKVPFLTGKYVSYIAVGGSSTCLMSATILYCFGDNQYGQLGLGHTNNIGDDPNEMGDKIKPIVTGINEKPNSITIGSNHICVQYLLAGVKCFGKNAFGELGQGDKVNRGGAIDTIGASVPIVDLAFANNTVINIHSGGSHTCVLFQNLLGFTDTVKCFGDASKGQLGYGDTSNRGDEPNEMGNKLQKVLLRFAPITRSPSVAPTFKPTKQPTRKPTKAPTAYPTRKPQ